MAGALAAALAYAFLADGPWTERALVERGRDALGGRDRRLPRVVRAVLGAYHRRPSDRPRELAAFVDLQLRSRRGHPRHWRAFEQRMAPTRWPVARIDTLGDLAEWLELDAGQLAWLADRRGLERTVAAEKLRNYRYGLLPRPGGVPRVLERPKRRLKEVQRSILRGILDAIPPHDAAHGFTRGRSAVTHAQSHERRRLVLRFDVEDFFCSVAAGRVCGIFRTAGYPESVAHALTALCTNVVPYEEWARVAPPREPWLLAPYRRLERRLATPHLPQGSPSSPALANLCAFRLDARLAGLAASVGAAYTRYADDLVLSGDERLRSVRHVVGEIAADEGFRLNERKSQLMTRAGRQLITGIVVNEHANLVRPEFDRLKATLHRAELNGPGALDRAHVLGRIAWVEQLNRARGAKLRERFDRIAW